MEAMTSLDSYITLGRSGLRVSPLTLGTMTFGEDWGWGASPETSDAILAEYLDRGGNVIDTANIYTNGHSEKIVGDFFAARPGLRDRVVLEHEVLRQSVPRRPERRWRRPQGDDRPTRGVAAAPADRLRRPLLAAQLGPARPNRRDAARAR